MPTDTKSGNRQRKKKQKKTRPGDLAGVWFAYFRLSLADGHLDAAAKAHAQLKKLGFTIQIGPPQPDCSDADDDGGAR